MKKLVIIAQYVRNGKIDERTNEIPVTDDFVTAFVDNYKSQTAAPGGKCPVHADGNNRMNIIVSLVDDDDQVIAGWRNM